MSETRTPGVGGPARVGHRLEDVRDRLRPGDVVVLERADIDPVMAAALLEIGPAAVVASWSMVSPRRPGIGPELLAQAGVVLVDHVGDEVLDRIRDGHDLHVVDGVLVVDGAEVGRGRLVSVEDLRFDVGRARASLRHRLTGAPLVDPAPGDAGDPEEQLVLDGAGLPPLASSLTGRPVLVVARTGSRPVDLDAVRGFLRQQHAGVVAVDKAADDVVAAGFAVDVAVVSPEDPGRMPGVAALRAARDVVVRVGRRHERPQVLDTLADLGVPASPCTSDVSSHDLALLLAASGGPSLVVALGLDDDPRASPASTLTRLRLGSALVDATSIPRLYTGRTRLWRALAGLLALLLVVVAVLALAGRGQSEPTPASTGTAPTAEGSTEPDAGGTGSGSEDESTESGRAAYLESFAAQAGARLYAGGLSDAPVAIVAMPGVDSERLTAFTDQVKAAGGRITGRFGARGALLDPGSATTVDALGTQLAGQLAPLGAAVDPAASPYRRIGQALGVAVASTAVVAPPSQASLAARVALADAGLISSPAVPVAQAPLVLVLLGPGDDLPEEYVDPATELVGGLGGLAAGVVVVGDEASAGDGVLAGLRGVAATGVLATVDDDGGALGPVATTLALIGVRQGRGGAFGAASAETAVPLG